MWVQLKAFVFSWAFGMAAIQHCMLWHFFYVDSCDRNVDCTTLPLWHSCRVGNTRIWGERWRCVSTSSSLWIFAEVFLSWRLLRRGSLTFISIISIGQSPFAPEKSQILTDCSLLNCLILKWEARFSSLHPLAALALGFGELHGISSCQYAHALTGQGCFHRPDLHCISFHLQHAAWQHWRFHIAVLIIRGINNGNNHDLLEKTLIMYLYIYIYTCVCIGDWIINLLPTGFGITKCFVLINLLYAVYL